MTDLEIPPVPQDAKLLPEPLSFKLRRITEETRDGIDWDTLPLRLLELADEAEALEALAHARRK